MPKAKIVIADNNRDFLEELQDFLKQDGYSVIPAGSVEAAKKVLQKRKYDAVILDVRLTNDRNADDSSGLRLAEIISPEIPKIILTRHPTYNIVREALGPGVKGIPAAVDFVDKKELQERLLPALEDAIFVKALQNGNEETWERFWQMEAWSLIALCRRHGIKTEEAVHICTGIFGELALLMKRPVKRSSLRAQLVSKALRKINQSPPRLRGAKPETDPPGSGVTGEILVNEELLRDIAATAVAGKIPRQEIIKRLTDAIERLPAKPQKILTLRLFRSVPTSVIAKEMKITEKTALKYMSQGFRSLKNALARLGE
jgi:CheY-like chemotaxis protein